MLISSLHQIKIDKEHRLKVLFVGFFPLNFSLKLQNPEYIIIFRIFKLIRLCLDLGKSEYPTVSPRDIPSVCQVFPSPQGTLGLRGTVEPLSPELEVR